MGGGRAGGWWASGLRLHIIVLASRLVGWLGGWWVVGWVGGWACGLVGMVVYAYPFSTSAHHHHIYAAHPHPTHLTLTTTPTHPPTPPTRPPTHYDAMQRAVCCVASVHRAPRRCGWVVLVAVLVVEQGPLISHTLHTELHALWTPRPHGTSRSTRWDGVQPVACSSVYRLAKNVTVRGDIGGDGSR